MVYGEVLVQSIASSPTSSGSLHIVFVLFIATDIIELHVIDVIRRNEAPREEKPLYTSSYRFPEPRDSSTMCDHKANRQAPKD